jgi:hypothetical protein
MRDRELYRAAVEANNTFLRTQEKQIFDTFLVTNYIKDAIYAHLQQLNVIGVKDVAVVFTKDFTKGRRSPGYQKADASYEDGVLTITIYSKRFLMEQNNLKNAQAEELALGQPSNTATVLDELRKLDPDTPLSPLAEKFNSLTEAVEEIIHHPLGDLGAPPTAVRIGEALKVDQKYAWAGDVYDYLDMYTKDIEDVLGVTDIRLYKDGIRMAVGLLFDAADKYEDKERKKSFKAYVVHKMLSHIDDLTRQVAKAEEMFTGVNQGLQMLSQSTKGYREPIPPHGFTGQVMPEIRQPDAYERALTKQRQTSIMDAALSAGKPGPYMG